MRKISPSFSRRNGSERMRISDTNARTEVFDDAVKILVSVSVVGLLLLGGLTLI